MTAAPCVVPPAGDLLDLDVALDRIAAATRPATGIETLPLAQALGRRLARDLIAPGPLPPFDTATRDGWAVRVADLGGGPLPQAGRAAAGHPLAGPLAGRRAARIFTGAMVPDGADAVVEQELCRATAEGVALPPALAVGANIRRAGADVAAGSVALPAGRRLAPQDLGLAAALGLTALGVFRPLRVALLSTGDELHPPGTPLPPGGLYDSNRTMLAALLAQSGAEVVDLGRLPDRRAAIAATLAGAAADGAHLILTSGGVSVGEEDHVPAALAEAGGHLDFWRLAIKPGRPLALGAVGGAVFAGLPGNPASALISFLLVVRPLLDGLAGGRVAPPPRFSVRSGFMLRRETGRREFLRTRLEETADGPCAVMIGPDDSGHHRPLVEADGLIDVPADLAVIRPGDLLRVLPLRGLIG